MVFAKYTTSCRYFTARSPGEIIENPVKDGEDYNEQNLPIDYLLDNHGGEIKKHCVVWGGNEERQGWEAHHGFKQAQ